MIGEHVEDCVDLLCSSALVYIDECYKENHNVTQIYNNNNSEQRLTTTILSQSVI